MTARPGPRNAITDVAGLAVGHAADEAARTGVSVILPDARVVCAVDVRGGGPGTRETDALAAPNLVRSVDALVLSGGSVYGLAAADGVVAWLGAQGRGFVAIDRPGVPRSPVVPAAILFDLANGGDKGWGLEPPYRNLGLRAAEAAAGAVTAGPEAVGAVAVGVGAVGLGAVGGEALGTVGAGYGAQAGRLKGGTGSASLVTADGPVVGALVAVNSLGSVTVPGGRHFWAAPFEIDAEFGGLGPAPRSLVADEWGLARLEARARTSTTLAVVATDAALTPDQASRVAIMAQDGLARAIRPVHTTFDGDVVFALSTARRPLPAGDEDLAVARLGAACADTLARAVARAVFEATLPPGMTGPTWRTC